MIALWIYLGICFIYACYSIYKQRTTYSIKGSFWNNVLIFLINFIIFPYSLWYTIKHDKIFHKHNWVYHDYIPYKDKMTPHGASYRKCTKCNKTETSWL